MGSEANHPDAVGDKAMELPTGACREARSGDSDSGSFPPYHAPWFASVAWGALLCAAYPLIILTPLAAFAIVSPTSDHALIVEIGVNGAVVAFTILALQFVISARLRWVEAPF